MVREGWALAYVKYSPAYRGAEDEARVHQRGLWKGAFVAPWDWRHRNDKTIVLGALSVPINAQPLLLPRSATEGAPAPNCIIKGNVNRNGERIYHMISKPAISVTILILWAALAKLASGRSLVRFRG